MIKLSVVCVTYNHERFIRQALDGFVMQTTNFPFEVIVSDDASHDNTPDIIKSYANKYPHLIHPVLRPKNVGAGKNFVEALARARSKYIALCEGDDYWIDPKKLQVQTDFLEKNSQYSICSHNVHIFNNETCLDDWPGIKSNPTITIHDLLRYGSGGATCSLVYRNSLTDFPVGYENLSGGDWILQILLSAMGDMYYFSKPMGVYRRHTGGKTHTETYQQQLDIFDKGGLQLCNFVDKHFDYVFHDDINYNRANYFYPNLLRISHTNKKWNDVRNYAFNLLKLSPYFKDQSWRYKLYLLNLIYASFKYN